MRLNTQRSRYVYSTKALYDLTYASRQWYRKFDNFIKKYGYSRSKYDSCVYFMNLPSDDYIYLLLYVDGILIASKHKVEVDKLKKMMKTEFKMKDLGEAKKTLGMNIILG